MLFLFATLFMEANAQTKPKQLPAKRVNSAIKIDANLDEAIWKETIPATGFVEWRPTFGLIEDTATRTEVYIVYDNVAIYVAGYCHERTKDSVQKELVGRDVIGSNDFVGLIFDTYYDKINGFGFYVTPLGEQFDAKYSNTNGEDGSWNAVWESASMVVADGWIFELRIPYSAIRFSNQDIQTWGLNITRNRRKSGRQFMWNPIDPKINGILNQSGEWTGIEKIESPLRLSFSPYFSTYVNHFPSNSPGGKDWSSSVNGGMDLKYGISEAFTLDMTLIPDFGQVQSDNQVLNLSPFEVRFNENRAFFTEGTELFNKGNLFYSRRVGGTPIHSGSVYHSLYPGESVVKNPQESKLVNATKISGRTKKGLGIGVFNAITKAMYAEVEDVSKQTRKIQTNPLTNYNIMVFDQTLKNNSSVSFINTNVMRSGMDYDANVSAGLFDFNNKKNTYNWNGKVSVSHLTRGPQNGSTGYSQNLGFGKTGGRWNFQLVHDIADEKYDINDMGILFNNNYVDHYFWTGYRWLTPGKWYNRIQANFNLNYSRLFHPFENQKVQTRFQRFSTNFNANVQLKSLWWFGTFIGYSPEGNDFYEPRLNGWSFRSTERLQFNGWVESNYAKKYYVSFNYFIALRKLFSSRNHEINYSHRYRFSDKFSISHDFYVNPFLNDAGFYRHFKENDPNGNPVLKDIIFSRRDRTTVENVLRVKYNFNNKSGITFRARHYVSKVEQQQFYDLQSDGYLRPTVHTSLDTAHQNFNAFNIDAVYTLQFAPGSFLNIVWKDAIYTFDQRYDIRYFRNLDNTFSADQNNNLSVKVIYYLDYLDFKKWGSKKTKNISP